MVIAAVVLGAGLAVLTLVCAVALAAVVGGLWLIGRWAGSRVGAGRVVVLQGRG